jgi:hypothetical protein
MEGRVMDLEEKMKGTDSDDHISIDK